MRILDNICIGKSRTDQLFTMRQLLKKSWEFNKTLHHMFIDFQKFYDSITRTELWGAMFELGIPRKLIQLTKMCVNGSKTTG